MITKSELIEYLKHTPENTNYNILYSSLYNGSNKEAVDEFIEVLSRGNLSLAALQPYLAKLYEDDKTISPEPLPPFSSGGGVQPDWNQNDETAADYVKNRPFYTGNTVETVLFEERTISFSNSGGTMYTAEFPSTFVATVGETYTVYWDGTAYECVCVDVMGIPCLGNFSIVEAGSDTGEPFIMIIYNGEGINIQTKDTSASHTISINGLATEVVKIDTKYFPFPFKPNSESYLTFSSRNSFTLAIEEHEKSWDGTLEYFASDKTWTVWDGAGPLSAVYNGTEYVMYLRGTGNTVITGNLYSSWQLDGSDIACIGNIETLLDYATVESGQHPTMGDNCYTHMFYFCTNLTRAPELPATTLASSCYEDMFYGCTSLTHAPELPATTLADDCYRGMFFECTSLTQVPELPATTLADNCYLNIFSYCESLKHAPALPATTLTSSCYEQMFLGCTSLIQAPELPAATLADNCYRHMFSGCTSLAHIPELPAITLARNCYERMFFECTSLKLSKTRTGEYTQEYHIPSSGDGVTANDALTDMFTSTGGTFTGTPEINKTYYLSSDNMVARGSDIANLNGYIKTMIDNAECIVPSSTPNSSKKFKITVDDSGAISATEVI